MNKQQFLDIFAPFIHQISQKVNLHGVVLFGSQARGNALEYSDYDVLIVADFMEKYLDRGKWIVQLAPLVAIDLFTYTPEEFHEKFRTYNLTAIDAIDEGIILYGDSYFAPYRTKLEEYKSRGMFKDTKHSVLVPPEKSL